MCCSMRWGGGRTREPGLPAAGFNRIKLPRKPETTRQASFSLHITLKHKVKLMSYIILVVNVPLRHFCRCFKNILRSRPPDLNF